MEECYSWCPFYSKKYTPEEEANLLKGLPVPMVWMLGGPGSGKTIMAKRLCARYRYTYVSIGDLLAKEVLKSSVTGKQIVKEMKDRKVVSRELTFELLKHYIARKSPFCNGFMFDGYPREVEQMRDLLEWLSPPSLILCLLCSDEIMKVRMYAKEGAPTENSTMQEIRKYSNRLLTRVLNFHDFVEPILTTYEDKEKIVKIDAEQDKLQVYLDCRIFMEELFKKLGQKVNRVFEEDTDFFV